MIKNITIGFLLVTILIVNIKANRDTQPEHITKELLNHYEWCYHSWQCVVPDNLYNIINSNAIEIINWREPLYK